MTSKKTYLLVGVFVATLTFVFFSPTLNYTFVNWDDTVYVTQNPHFHPVTIKSIGWLFTHSYFRSWTPVSLFSHAVDVKLWQFNPFGHHLSNIILHSLNAALVFWLSIQVFDAFGKKTAVRQLSAAEPLTARADRSIIVASVFAALLFSLHPLRAESVSWVSDRKDLLCAFFMLLTSIVYFTHKEDPNRILGSKVLLVCLYALALGSKSIAIVLPVMFVLLDVFLFQQKLIESVKEKMLLLVLAAGTAVLAKLAAPELSEDFVVGDKTPLQLFSFPFASTLFYLKKLVLPEHLSPVYHTNAFLPTAESAMVFVAPIVFVAITVVCLIQWRRGRNYWIAAWGTFVLFLLPTFLGLLSGIQPVADRYTYFASISMCLLAGGGVGWVLRARRGGLLHFKNVFVLTLCAACLSLLSYKTIQQTRVWKDPMTLWTYVIPRAPFPVAYNNYGNILVENKRYDEAVVSFENAIKLRPAYGEAMCNMGIAYNKMGQPEKAIAWYIRAIQAQPDFLNSYINLGTEYLRNGMTDSAIATYRGALAFDTTVADVYYNIALALMKQRKYVEAVVEYRKALTLAPAHADAWYNLGVAYEAHSQNADAVTAYSHAIELKEDYFDAYINLGNVFAAQHQFNKAIEIFSKAVVVNPRSADAFYNLGTVLYYNKEVDKAFGAFQMATERDSTYAKAYHNLGIIYAAKGIDDQALQSFQKAAHLGYAESKQILRNKGFSW